MKTLTGLVLCGGKSLRMGSDKGLLKTDNQTWAELAFEKLNQVCEEVFVSVNHSQIMLYNGVFETESLITDSVSVPGPLAGLLSFCHCFPEKDMLLLACDMPLMTTNTLQMLAESYLNDAEKHDFYVFQVSDFPEPLCGIYTASGLKKVYSSYLSGNMSSFSLQPLFKQYPAVVLSAPNIQEFQNCNTPEDLI